VLLTEEQEFETWLSGSPAEAFGLVRSFDPDRMRIVQEGFDKEDLLGQPSARSPPKASPSPSSSASVSCKPTIPTHRRRNTGR